TSVSSRTRWGYRASARRERIRDRVSEHVANFADALVRIRSRADCYDLSGDWPEDDLSDLADAGVMRCAVPAEVGGTDEPAVEIHLRYEKIATASLATALILSQRDSACGLIDGAKDSPLRGPMLSSLAQNEWFTTVGIAQLTTSRQRGAPAMLCTRVEDAW